ncbi:MAG: hypothetical protein KDD48_07075, partial [Bdellovibrionales bacterium]|nr:hypothetical protein [Bdellovibrionales bacterium]
QLVNKFNELTKYSSAILNKDSKKAVYSSLNYLKQTAKEFEEFVATLPKSTKEAETYYGNYRFRLGKALAPSKKQKRSQHKQKNGLDSSRNKFKAISKVNSKLFIVFILSILIAIFINIEEIGHALFFWRGDNLGTQLGVYEVAIENNRWVGTTRHTTWKGLRPDHREKLGAELFEQVKEKGFSGLVILDSDGKILAESIYLDNDLVFRIVDTKD